jgi:acyl-CoA oxidase
MNKPVDERVLPFAPLLHVLWADGQLSNGELTALREHVPLERLDAGTRAALLAWLDTAQPPDPRALDALRRSALRAAADGAPPATLAELGTRIARTHVQDAAALAGVEAVLLAMEAAIGLPGAEAARSLVPEAVPELEAAPSFDASALHRFLNRDHFELRQRVLRILSTPEFTQTDTLDHAAHRELVLQRCRRLAHEGLGALAYPAEFGGLADVTAQIAVFETLAYGDQSLLVKYGVQFGLFAGSIYQLGTRVHHERFLKPALDLDLPGCFAMTETAHGSNVRDIETRAEYDHAAREFVIHTPHRDARKDYIGNAARHGRMATVFAQLGAHGAEHGVHAFLVPLRDEQGRLLPGIEIEDCGRKAGLNGVDNGRIRFTNVRIPREQLLDRFGRMAEDGSYTSEITSPTRRFFTMLGTLVSGRLSIAAAACNAAKSGLTIAIRYAARRRQFGPEGRAEVPILDYRTMQLRLLPRLATAYALEFALRDVIRRFAGTSQPAPDELQVLVAGLKAYASDFAVQTLQAGRQACGGQGYMSVNQLPRLQADTEIFTTFEGANTVLLQLVTKGLLTDYREQFGELRLWNVMQWVRSRAAAAIDRNPIVTRRTDEAHLLDPDFQHTALRYREDHLLDTLARRLRRRLADGMDTFAALNECQDHAVALARAHVERFVAERFHDAAAACEDQQLARPLRTLASLHGLGTIARDRAWFLEQGVLESAKSKAIRDELIRLCQQVRVDAVALVDAFGIPAALLPAPIAFSSDHG